MRDTASVFQHADPESEQISRTMLCGSILQIIGELTQAVTMIGTGTAGLENAKHYIATLQEALATREADISQYVIQASARLQEANMQMYERAMRESHADGVQRDEDVQEVG